MCAGQRGFDSLADALPAASASSPRLEHRGHVSHFFRNVSAPAPGPAAGESSAFDRVHVNAALLQSGLACKVSMICKNLL